MIVDGSCFCKWFESALLPGWARSCRAFVRITKRHYFLWPVKDRLSFLWADTTLLQAHTELLFSLLTESQPLPGTPWPNVWQSATIYLGIGQGHSSENKFMEIYLVEIHATLQPWSKNQYLWNFYILDTWKRLYFNKNKLREFLRIACNLVKKFVMSVF